MICPHCNAELKDDAKFCPHCGSDDSTGWKENAEFASEELPDYEEIIENEFGDDPHSPYYRKKKSQPLTIAIAVIVITAFVAVLI